MRQTPALASLNNMKRWHKTVLTLGAFGALSNAPLIQQDTPLMYSYESNCAVIEKLNASLDSATSTPAVKAFVPDECALGAGKVYVSVFRGMKGDLQYKSITSAQYGDMGKPGGYELNPKSTESVTPILFAATRIATKAEAACGVGNTASGSVISATSVTYSLNNNGTTVVTTVNNNTTANSTGVTYNGVAETLVIRQNTGANRNAELWAITSPAAGANNVVVSFGISEQIETGSVAFTNAGAVNNAQGTETASGGTLYSLTVTTSATGCVTTSLTTGNRTISNYAGASEYYNILPLDQRGNGTTILGTGSSQVVTATISSAAASNFVAANVDAAAATAGPVYENDEWMEIFQ